MAKLSEYYSDAPGIPSSLWAMFDACANAHKDDVALTVMHQAADYLSHLKANTDRPTGETRCLQWTYSDLQHAVIQVASAFQKQGVQRGGTMVTLITNGVECVVLLWVSAILQLTFAPLDPRLLDSGREQQLIEYMKRLNPAVVVAPDGTGSKAVDEALKAADVETALKLSLAGSGAQGWHGLADIISTGSDQAEIDDNVLAQDSELEQDSSRIGLTLFTSGSSSGKPKGCCRTVRNLVSAAIAGPGYPNVPDRIIVHTPNSGSICQAFLILCGHTGQQIIIPAPMFSPTAALDAIERHRAELMVAIPIMSRIFEKELAGRDMSALKEIAIGGDMVTADAQEKWEKLFPQSHVVVGHGMTEGHSVIGWAGSGIEHSCPQYHSILGVGYPQPGALVRICDEENKVVPRGTAGELQMGGAFVIPRYLENAQPEAFYSDEKGHWIRTGDRAVMDESGAIFIVGRIKDIIKRVGMALSPAVAESVLNRIEGVEASVFGVPHPDFGEVPLAVVKDPEQAADSTHLRKAMTDSLGSDYALQDVKSLADLGFEAWPLTESDKIAKRELKNAYLSKFGC